MNSTLTLLTCCRYFQPVYLLGNEASIPRSAYFILTDECFHTHEKGLSQLWKSVPKGYALCSLSLCLDGDSLALSTQCWRV